jgi:hypothetical protein
LLLYISSCGENPDKGADTNDNIVLLRDAFPKISKVMILKKKVEIKIVSLYYRSFY